MKDTEKYPDTQRERSCPWAQTLDTQRWDTGGGDDTWHCLLPKSISQGSVQQNNNHHHHRALWVVTGDDYTD